MPHPLPVDVQAVAGMRYFLVALPDDSAFLQAALAIYSELENSYKWGLEGEIIPDSEDAAQLWAASVAETVRLIQMGWPDQVLEYIDDIESMLRAINRLTGCCPDGDVSDGDLYTDEVEDGVGSVPQNIVDAGYAVDGSDWEGFATYKCMIAHIVIDDLAGKLRKLAPLVDDAGLVIGGIGAIAAIIAALLTGGGFAIAIGILGSVGAVAALYSKISDGSILLDIANDVDTHHDELACAFMTGDGASGAVSAMYSEIDNLFGLAAASILKNLNSRPVAKALYAGRYDQQDIAATLASNGYVASSYNCDCVEPIVDTLGLVGTVTAATNTDWTDTRLYATITDASSVAGVWSTESEIFRFPDGTPRTFAKGSAVVLNCGVYDVELGGFNTPEQYDNPYFTFRFRNLAGSSRVQGCTIRIDKTSLQAGDNCINVSSVTKVSGHTDTSVSGNVITFATTSYSPGQFKDITISLNA